jgi:hypothetical protein
VAYAKHILDLLAAKHSKDVFVPECKDGPTQSVSEYMRMDAWVMNRSWAHPCYTVYEIKVSRSDFLNDKKWRNYLPYCNEFFFVAPKGLIQVAELPPEAGLLELLGGADGKRLVRRKQTVWRDVTPPESLFRYVLMCRAKVGRNEYLIERTKEERAEDWRRFIADKAENRNLGLGVGRAIRETVASVKKENERLVKRMEEYDDVRSFLSGIGMDPDHAASRWSVEDRLREQQDLFPKRWTWAMRDLRNAIDTALKHVEPKEANEGAA